MTTSRNLRLLRTIPLILIAVLLLALAMTGSASAQVSLPLRGESGEMILGLGSLEDAVYSPDGKYIATAGSLGGLLMGRRNRRSSPHLPRAYGLGPFRGVFAGRDAGPDGE